MVELSPSTQVQSFNPLAVESLGDQALRQMATVALMRQANTYRRSSTMKIYTTAFNQAFRRNFKPGTRYYGI